MFLESQSSLNFATEKIKIKNQKDVAVGDGACMNGVGLHKS